MTTAAITLLLLTALATPTWVLATRKKRNHAPVSVVRRLDVIGAVVLLVLATAVEVDSRFVIRLFGGPQVAVRQLTDGGQTVGHGLGVGKLDGVSNVYAAKVSLSKVEHVSDSRQGSTESRDKLEDASSSTVWPVHVVTLEQLSR